MSHPIQNGPADARSNPAVAAPAPDDIADAAWRTSCLRLCMHLGLDQAPTEKWTDTLHKIARAAIELSGFVLETEDLNARKRRYYVAELALQRWPTIAPEDLPRVVKALARGCVEDVPAGGFAALRGCA